MRKGQSLVIQFTLFFLIGLGLFVVIGNVFKSYSDVLREDIAAEARKLLNSYFSSLAVISINSCKQCNYVEVKTKVENTTADYFHQVTLSSLGLNVISQPGTKNFLASIHNLNTTYSLLGTSSSAKTIIFTFTKNQNKLEAR
ncbi:MAG: hypothetical protein QXQ18_00610 [Candidatus Aenigmatarchaeota archaeon]